MIVNDSVANSAGINARILPRWMVVTRRALIGAALALMVFYLAVYLLYTISLMRFPFDYDEGEGFEVNNAVLLSHGQWPYMNNDHYPFYGTDYPPLFHLALVPLIWLFGPQYWYGRLIVSAATMLTAAAIGYAVFRETRHRPIALLSGLAFLASNYIYHIGPLFRQHMVMVMFEMLAVVMIAGFENISDPVKRRRRIALTMLLLLAAGFTKPLSIFTSIAVLGYLFLRGPRRALGWGIALAVIAGALFGLLYVSTQGNFWTNVITGNLYDYLMGQFVGLLRQFISLHGALLVIAVAFLIYELYFDRLSMYSIWFVFAGANGIASGKWGAGDSYFAEMIAAMCILAGIFTGRSLNRQWKLPPRFAVFVARLLARFRLSRLIPALAQTLTPVIGLLCCGLFIVYGIAVLHMPLDGPIFGTLARTLNIQSNTKFPNFYDSAGWTMGYATIGQMPTDTDIQNGWKIVDAIPNDSRPILSEEAAFSFHTNKPVLTNPPHILGLYQSGHFDPTDLVKMINEQRFGAVIFREASEPPPLTAFYPQPVLEAVTQAYQLKQTIPMNGYVYAILVPNPDWPAQHAALQGGS